MIATRSRVSRASLALLVAAALIGAASSANAQKPYAPSPPSSYYPPSAGPESSERVSYVNGEPVPDGWHVEGTPRYGLVAAGATVTSTLSRPAASS